MNRLLSLLRLKRSEVPRLLLAGGAFYLIAVNDGIVKSVSAAVFNVRVGVDHLPLMYTWIAVLFSVVMGLLSYLTARVARQRLLFGLFGALGVVLAFNTLILWLEHGGVEQGYSFYSFLFVSSELARGMAGFYIWIAAGGICYTSRAKVLFPLLAASTTFGDISGGFLVRLLGGLLESYQIYGLAALNIVAVVALLRVLVRRYFVAETGGRDEGAPLGENLRYFGRSRYLQLIFVLSIAVFALYTAIHYGFNVVVRQSYPDEGGITAAFGLFYALAGITTLVATTFLLPLALRLIGAGSVYLWVCLLYALLALGLLSAVEGLAGLEPVVVLFAFNLINFLLLDSIVAPTYQVLVKLVPPRHSDGTRMLMEGGFMLVGGLLGAGLTGLHAGGALSLGQLFGALAVLAGAMAVVGGLLRRSHTKVLVQAVREQDLDVDDDQTMAAFKQLIGGADRFPQAMLLDADDGVRQLGIEILQRHPGRGASRVCTELLDHDNAAVRAAALTALRGCGAGEEALAAVLPLLGDADGQVRQAALGALVWLVGADEAGVAPVEPAAALKQQVIDAVLPLLEVEEAGIQAECIAVLNTLDHRPSQERRQQVLDRLLRSDAVETLVDGIRAAAATRFEASLPRLLELVVHGHPAVREAVARTLGRSGGVEGFEALMDLLADPDPDVVEAAVGALSRYEDPSLRQRMIEAMEARPLSQWAGLLRALAAVEDAAVRPRLLAACQKRLVQANRYVVARELLEGHRGHAAVDLLADQLRLQERIIQDAVVGLLGELEDRQVVEALVERLAEGDAASRSNAIELLEHIAAGEILEKLLPLLEEDPREKRVAVRRAAGWEKVGLDEALTYLLERPGEWTQMAAVWAAYVLGRDYLIGRVRTPFGAPARESIAELQAQKGSKTMDADQPLTTMEKITFLKGSSFFAALPLEELYQIALSVQEEGARQGDEVIREGTMGDKMYIVIRGRLEVVRRGEGDAPQRLAVLEEKSVFGDMALIDAEPRSATVVALEDAGLLSLHRRDLERILRRYSSIAFNMMRILSRRLRESMAA